MGENKLKTFTEIFKDQDKNDVRVETVQFMGFRGLNLQTTLVRLALPLFSGIKSFKRDLGNIDIDSGTVINHLLSNITESKVSQLVKDLIANTTVDNKDLSVKANFDFMIAGNYTLLFNIIKFVIEKNNFFGEGGIGTMFNQMMEKLDKMQSMPQESES